MPFDEKDLQTLVQNDAGHPAFVELAEGLYGRGLLKEALEVCLKGLSRNPSAHIGRLLLARIYFELECYPFAIREIELLCRALPKVQTLRRILERLAPARAARLPAAEVLASNASATVAETDFSIEELDLLAEEDKTK
ncbi:MAG: hypothetical protein K1X79_04770 [Oligoflexia bacterium]|nr:hypothetical protein [Oligoflexia bacterium]